MRCEARTFGPDGGRYQCDRLGCDGQHEVDYSGPMHKRGDLVHRWTDAPAALPAPQPDDGRPTLADTVTDLAREAEDMGLPVSDGWAEASDELGLSEEDAERLRPVWVAAFERRRAERVEGERPPLHSAADDGPGADPHQVPHRGAGAQLDTLLHLGAGRDPRGARTPKPSV